MTASLLPALRRQFPGLQIAFTSQYPELFECDPNIAINGQSDIEKALITLSPRYYLNPRTRTPILAQMAASIGVQPPSAPVVYLTSGDIQIIASLPDRYIAICPNAKEKFAGNRKQWGYEHYQDVVDSVDWIPFVQVGLGTDKLLRGVYDFRGLPIRQSAAVLQSATMFFGSEGGLMHLARAVETRSVIVYGGYISPVSSGYECNLNISSSPSCSPCIDSTVKIGNCLTMECMRLILPQTVSLAIRGLYREVC